MAVVIRRGGATRSVTGGAPQATVPRSKHRLELSETERNEVCCNCGEPRPPGWHVMFCAAGAACAGVYVPKDGPKKRRARPVVEEKDGWAERADPQCKLCDGTGWRPACGPYRDGSYITTSPCPCAGWQD